MKVLVCSKRSGLSVIKCDCGHHFNLTLDPKAHKHFVPVMCPKCKEKKELTY